MTAINYKDPRFQRAMLKAHADPTSNKLAAQQGLTSAFATQQLGVQNQFAELAQNKKQFNQRMHFARKGQRLQSNIFKRQLSDARSANRIGLIGGVGTSMIAGLIGRDRRNKLKTEAAADNAYKSKQLKLQETHNALLERIIGGTN